MQLTVENIISYITSIGPDDIIPFITSININPEALQKTLIPMQIGFFILACIFLAIIIYVLSRSKWAKIFVLEKTTEFFTYHPYGMKKKPKDWSKILEKLKTGKESEYKLAVVEADKTINEVLMKNYRGETFEDRLSAVSPTIVSDIDKLRENHKIRNEIVYDPDYELSLDDAKKMLKIYEKALFELRFI